ncbi:MAG: agmatinase [Opitutales bacterium]|nr:agmatinase [Opitutales bacterium]
MLNKTVENFIGCDAGFDGAKIVLFGAPFDGTVSYRPGTRFAPKAIRAESFGLETYSPYLDRDLTDISVFDMGDLEFCFGNPQKVLDKIEETAAEILAADKIPFMVGGEHLVTLGAFRAAAKKFPQIRIIHFDAHTDLRGDYLGEELSHASVIRRCHDIIGDGKIFQYGIRSGDRPEFEWAKSHVFMNKFNLQNLDVAVDACKDFPVYLTLDLDVLDPSIFPGTGTPEAGGASFDELREALMFVMQNTNIVACDVNELSPQYDPSGVSTAVAGKIIREMLLSL